MNTIRNIQAASVLGGAYAIVAIIGMASFCVVGIIAAVVMPFRARST